MKSFPPYPTSAPATILILALLWVTVIFPNSLGAQSVNLLTFGEGKVGVRVYTDYFCGPCRAGEPKIEALLHELVHRKSIKLTFVDTPVHQETQLYARYFLYVLNSKKDFDHALLARRALFDAASIRIITREKLEEFLTRKGIGFIPFDVKPTLAVINQYMNEDGVKSTPTVVIDIQGKKQRHSGTENIVKALQSLQ